MDLTAIGAIGLLVLIGYLVYLKLNTSSPAVDDPASILKEVDVYLAYGRRDQALRLLDNAIANGEADPGILAKREELRQ